MLTNYPIGFISYNSHDFLKFALEQLINDGIFKRCACWYHESLGKEKDHFHVYAEPAKKIDTECLQDKFIELLEDGTQNSVAILPRCKSDWNNAYLYGIHDIDYLAFKGLEREQVNIKSDLHIYLGDFTCDFVQADHFRFKYCLAPYQRLKELVMQGKSLEEVYIILRTPFSQLSTVRRAYKSIELELWRNSTHFDIK